MQIAIAATVMLLSRGLQWTIFKIQLTLQENSMTGTDITGI